MTHDRISLELREWGPPTEVDLNAQEVKAVRLLGHRLEVEILAEGRVRIGPKAGFVGIASLSSRVQVMVRPKAPIRSLLDLIALAYRTAPMPPTVGDAALEEAEPAEWLAWLLLLEAEELLTLGLRNGYVVLRDEIPYVRGRLQFVASDRIAAQPLRLPCEFSDFVVDTTENRILRGTIEILATGRIGVDLRARALTLLRALDSVTLVRPTLAMFSGLTQSRLNRHYAPALELCRLFLEGSGLELNLGDVVARSFFVPMERVFQLALANALRERLGAAVHDEPSFGDRFEHIDGQPDLGIVIRPDVLVGSRAAPRFVIDAKYSNAIALHRGQPTFSNPNIYQLATYCRALGCDGCLVYPRFDADVKVAYAFSGGRLSLEALDLNLPGGRGVRDFATRLTTALSEPVKVAG